MALLQLLWLDEQPLLLLLLLGGRRRQLCQGEGEQARP